MPNESIDEAVHSVIRQAVSKAMDDSTRSLTVASEAVERATSGVNEAAGSLKKAASETTQAASETAMVAKELKHDVLVILFLLWLFALGDFFQIHEHHGWPLPWHPEGQNWEWTTDTHGFAYAFVILEVASLAIVSIVILIRRILKKRNGNCPATLPESVATAR